MGKPPSTQRGPLRICVIDNMDSYSRTPAAAVKRLTAEVTLLTL